MRVRWMLVGVAVALGVGVLTPGTAQAGEVCGNEAACTAACDAGNAVACTALGDILGQGRGRDPDHAEALKRYIQACDGTSDHPATDPLGCHGAADLYETGWLFEVTKDTYMASSYRDVAQSTGIPRCAEGGPEGGRGCYAAAKSTRFLLDRDPESYKYEGATEVSSYLEQLQRACNLGQIAACNDARSKLWGLVNSGLLDSDKASELSEPASKKLTEYCMAGQAEACQGVSYEITQDPKERKALLTALETRCKAGAADACLFRAGVNFEAAGENAAATDPAVVEFFRVIRDVCVRTSSTLCAELGSAFVSTSAKEILERWDQWDPAFGVKVLKFQCNAGTSGACEYLVRTLAPNDSGDTSDRVVPADIEGAKAAGERACKLTPPVSGDASYNECPICDTYGDLGECQLRKAYQSNRNCQAGTLEACEDLGDRYAEGLGVDKNAELAAQSFKNACDGSVKSSCAKLDALCRDNEGMSEDMCAPSLLHTDVFYEAEWQFRQNQTATLQSGKKETVAAVGAVTLADAGGGGGAGVSMARGSLNADLVVSIVLDRARQAAMRVVVDELGDRMRQIGIRTYMRDLLAQGATLMSDSTNLRRDTLHDLGMTLVRAFAASNLVRTVLGTPDAVKRAKVLGPIVSTWKAEWISKEAGRLAPELEAYLADSAYWALGGQPLLSGTGTATAPAPACPFTDARKELCTVLAKRDQVTLALHVDGVLAALNMARALGTEGGIDVRRLIEAVAQSKAIVDFAATPGLNLYAWQSRIVDDQRYRLSSLRDRLGALLRLVDPETYSDKGPPDVYALGYMASSVRAFLDGDGRALVGDSVSNEIYSLLAMDSYVGTGGFGNQVTPETLAAARKDALASIARLGDTWRKGLQATVEAARARIDVIAAKLAELGRGLTSITATLKYHQPQGNDASVHLRIDKVPLADLDVLIDAFRPLIKTLDEVDTGMRDLLPGTDLRGVRFARSSAVRLLGFLDLMSRVARAGGINQTVRDVVDTLQLLGRYKKGEFTAPLYDMLQPVLEFIETRTPMPLEQLFAIVGRVRLDGLVTSLALGDSPCAKEDRAECWVFKLAYSLQEAISRDGNNIKIDGAEVAKRLADFGDDFQRRNKGRWYLHLTVGAGMMRTQPPGGGGMRTAPMIAEQIGFGFATPAFWKDRLTLKFGLAGSGLLYRAVLDNAESDAVIGSAFVALDVYDVIELYGAANVLAYPPADGADATLKTGFSAGLSVPLSAYLEKL